MTSIIKELIQPLPGYTILHATSKIDDIALTLSELIQEVGGHLNLALYQTENTLPPRDYIKTQLLSSYNDIFRAIPRDNDVVVLYDIYAKHTNKIKLLKNIYMTLANAGHLIIIEQNL